MLVILKQNKMSGFLVRATFKTNIQIIRAFNLGSYQLNPQHFLPSRGRHIVYVWAGIAKLIRLLTSGISDLFIHQVAAIWYTVFSKYIPVFSR